MDIHCVMSINPADFIDPLTFPLVFPLAITVLMYLMRYLDIDGFAKKKKFFANIHASQSINSNDFGTRDCSSCAIIRYWFRVKCSTAETIIRSKKFSSSCTSKLSKFKVINNKPCALENSQQ